LLQSPGEDVAKSRLSQAFAATISGRIWRASIAGKIPRNPAGPMTLSVANTAEAATPTRGLLPLWVGAGVYALFLLAGNRLLIDPDT
jgi:hypothetical protein